jgi:hypothetical protein
MVLVAGCRSGRRVTRFDPAALLEHLAAHHVDFLVVGQGGAVLLGAPTTTIDLDIVPKRALTNAERLAEALAEINARRVVPGKSPGEWPAVEERDFLGWGPLSLMTDFGPLDVVPHPTAVGGYEDLLPRAQRVDIGRTVVGVVSLDDIIAAKEALGRAKDLVALPALYEARRRRDLGGREPG